jgi:two-component system NtrC family sensor kinase
MDMKIEAIDLKEVFLEVFSFLEKEAFHRNINVQLKLDDSLPQIYADYGQLQQVFLNILNNAFTAVKDGGSVVVTSWDHDSEFVGISITDDGEGMSEETKKHIFDPFFTTRTNSGTGLGLSITYGIVKKLGGYTEVHSKEGEGTTFTVFLPKNIRQGMEA